MKEVLPDIIITSDGTEHCIVCGTVLKVHKPKKSKGETKEARNWATKVVEREQSRLKK